MKGTCTAPATRKNNKNTVKMITRLTLNKPFVNFANMLIFFFKNIE